MVRDPESCRFRFVLDEKRAVVSVGSAGERSGGAKFLVAALGSGGRERKDQAARYRQRNQKT